MNAPFAIQVCHHGGQTVRHPNAVMAERASESPAQKAAFSPRTYGTHTLPGAFWSAGPRVVDPAFTSRRANRAASKHGVRETFVGKRGQK